MDHRKKDEPETRAVAIHTFVAARVQELKALSARAAGTADPSKVPFKHIPKHLRRRAVSHNVKRLPFRFRPKQDAVPKGTKGDPLSFISDKKRTKSRKSKRRKSNLLSLYNNRQRVVKWLETHIWHAKRFRMESKWGYKIPISSCNKGLRPMYRSIKNYCTVQDTSFYWCFELIGPPSVICEKLKMCLPEPCNSEPLDHPLLRSGEREGTFHMYHRDTYPYGYIGVMKVVWLKCSKSHEDSSISSLWVTVHPSVKDELIAELTSVFGLERGSTIQEEVPVEGTQVSTDQEKKAQTESIDVVKLKPKTELWTPFWFNEKENIRLNQIQGQMNRIRLCGPATLGVLKEVLRPTPASMIQSANAKDNLWFETFPMKKLFSNTKWVRRDWLEAQSILWELLVNAADLPPRLVLPLLVRDPRVFLPRARSQISSEARAAEASSVEAMTVDEVDNMDMSFFASVPVIQASVPSKDDTYKNVVSSFVASTISPLEDDAFRQSFVNLKMSDQEFCRRRSDLLVPGSEIDLGREENQIPIILIHRSPSTKAKSLDDSGFDLIVPAAWAMSFWLAITYRSARAAGLRDAVCEAFQARNLHSSLFLAPDTKSGIDEEKLREQVNQKTYFSYPPAKRENLIKLNCVSPFSNNWSEILNFCANAEKMELDDSSSESGSQYFVLRDAAVLKRVASNLETRFWRKLIENLKSIRDLDKCLIGCRVEVSGKGAVQERAIICLPTEEDLLLAPQEAVLTHSGPKTYEEPPQLDSAQVQRKELRKKHENLMGLLRRTRKKIRIGYRNRVTTTSTRPELLFFKTESEKETKAYSSALLSKKYNETMNSYWLIPATKFRESLSKSTRSPIGFTIYGELDYSRGKSAALGYITAQGLLRLAELCERNKKLGKFVLTRNWTTSYVYSRVKLEIMLL